MSNKINSYTEMQISGSKSTDTFDSTCSSKQTKSKVDNFSFSTDYMVEHCAYSPKIKNNPKYSYVPSSSTNTIEDTNKSKSTDTFDSTCSSKQTKSNIDKFSFSTDYMVEHCAYSPKIKNNPNYVYMSTSDSSIPLKKILFIRQIIWLNI